MFEHGYPPHTKEEYVKVMLEYRVNKCDKRNCTNCFGYHNEDERRRPPVALEIKAQECPETKDKINAKYDSNGRITCSRGEECEYFHTVTEWFHPASYKRKKHDPATCRVVNRGMDIIYCSYLHDEDNIDVIEEARSEATLYLSRESEKRNKKEKRGKNKERKKREKEKKEREKRIWEEVDANENRDRMDDYDYDDDISTQTDSFESKSPTIQDHKTKKEKKKEKAKAKKIVPTPQEQVPQQEIPVKVTPVREIPQENIVSQTSSSKNQSKRTKTPTFLEQTDKTSNQKGASKTPTPSPLLNAPSPTTEPMQSALNVNTSNDTKPGKKAKQKQKTNNNNVVDNQQQQQQLSNEFKSVYEEYDEKDVNVDIVANIPKVVSLKGEIVAIAPSWVQIRTDQCGHFILETSHIWGLPSDWQSRKTLRCGTEMLFNPARQRASSAGGFATYGCLLLPALSAKISLLRSRPPFVTVYDARNILARMQLSKVNVNLINQVDNTSQTFELLTGSTIRDLRINCAQSSGVPVKSIAISQMPGTPALKDEFVIQYAYESQNCVELYLHPQAMHNRICSEERWKAVVAEIAQVCYNEYWGYKYECLNYYLSSMVDLSIERNWMVDEHGKTYVDTWLQAPNTFESIYLVFVQRGNGTMDVQYELSERSNRKDIFAESGNRVTKGDAPQIEDVADKSYEFDSERGDPMPTYLPTDTKLVYDVGMLSDRAFMAAEKSEATKAELNESIVLTEKLFSRNRHIAVPSYNVHTNQVVFYLPLYSVPASASSTSQPCVLCVAEAHKVVASTESGSERTLLVIHGIVSTIIAYMNTRIAGTSMPSWMVHSIGLGRPDPMQEVALGMCKYVMQRKTLGSGDVQDVIPLVRESLDYVDRIAGITVPFCDYQTLTESFNAAKTMINGEVMYNFNVSLDPMCFVCGNGAHVAFRVAKSKESGVCLVPYVKCEHCGNCIRAHKIQPIRV